MNNITGILYLVDVDNDFNLIPIDLSNNDLQLGFIIDLYDDKGNKFMFYKTEDKVYKNLDELKAHVKKLGKKI